LTENNGEIVIGLGDIPWPHVDPFDNLQLSVSLGPHKGQF